MSLALCSASEASTLWVARSKRFISIGLVGQCDFTSGLRRHQTPMASGLGPIVRSVKLSCVSFNYLKLATGIHQRASCLIALELLLALVRVQLLSVCSASGRGDCAVGGAG